MNNKNCIFTIVATNYVGLAQSLEKSIKRYNGNVDFYVVVADEPTTEIKNKLHNNVLIAKEILDYTTDKWYEMAFKYNLTEFCTSIKPSSISYFFSVGYDKVAYFDPDILCFNNLSYIWNILDNFHAIVTPHILTPETAYTGNLPEIKFLFSGVFNMGFAGYRNTSEVKTFLSWWKKRLEDYCYGDNNLNLFTDQKWVDMLPCFLGSKLFISRNKGMNVAPWNFHERKILIKDSKYLVTNRICADDADDLLFVHYSGYNYKTLINGEIIQQNISDIQQYDDLLCLFKDYGDALNNADINSYINEIYSYNYCFDNNFEINNVARRLFRGYVDNGNKSGCPFDVSSDICKTLIKKGFIKKKAKLLTTKYEESSTQVSNAIKVINMCFSLLFKILGASKYYNMTRALRKYGIWENHSFLIIKAKELYRLRRN